MNNLSDLENLFNTIHTLKHLKRSGWLHHGVAEDTESVADHSWGTALLAMVFAQKLQLDVGRAVTIAVLHDIGESIIGDITPHDGVTKQAKQKKETAAVKSILEPLEGGAELFELWLEYEHGTSEEGRLVKQLDKLEALLQGRQYKLSPERLAEFKDSTDTIITDQTLRDLLDQLK